MNLNLNPWRRIASFPFRNLITTERSAVKMAVDSLVQAAFASAGSSDMCYPALWIVDYVDSLQMRDG